ncbi:hypothetical protein [Amycolatopsis sp. ATCC 39116]|uniref:AbiTii domain-containing protein n=1 Tax=Amycolatopsis sp. (strain ATCC 39116 / 75iv2) TaxID=385957 RepID=UPI0012FA6A77|nr:hypothetical protein [Amycolatopsis sp. ATCC 39116]
MSRQDEALRLAEELLADVELSRVPVSKSVLKAMRLARLVRDYEAQEWLNFEISGVPSTDKGTEWMTRAGRWSDRSEGKGYWLSLLALESHKESTELAISAMSNGNLSGDMVVIASRERMKNITQSANTAAMIGRVLAQVESHVYDFASRTYYELMFSELQASLFEDARTAIDGRLSPLAGEALKKIDSIAERLRDGESEAVSQAMLTCRRLIDGVADAVLPPSDQPFKIGDQELAVKQGNVLNRINAYVYARGVVGGRAARIRRAIGDIYARVSTGVHKDVDEHEARYLFLSVYVLLGEILTLPQQLVESEAGTTLGQD